MLLSAVDVEFGYADRGRPPATNVVDDVSLEVRRGEIVAILGPNGSGKTTLLKLLTGSLKPSRGRITLDDQPYSARTRRLLARRIGVVPQETSLAFDYTVLEMVLMGRYPHLGTFEIEGPDDLAAARAALESTGAIALVDRPYRTLSGGEKQRVVIASALAQISGSADSAGSMLVLDEPTASLDLRYQFEVGALLRTIHDERGVTILLSTHDLRFAATLATRIVLLSNGRILAEGLPATVLTPELIGALFGVEPALAAPILASARPDTLI